LPPPSAFGARPLIAFDPVKSNCARCQGELAVQAGRTRIVSGRVELFCAPCWVRRDEPVAARTPFAPIDTKITLTPPRRNARYVIAGAALLVGVAGIGIAARHTTPASAALPVVDVRTDVAAIEPVQTVAEDVAPADDPAAIPMTPDGAEPLDDRFPSLKDWIHPVTDSPELVPTRSTRKFGAVREGVERGECGHGHCGLDLDGPRGRPVVAVAYGTVVRVEHSKNGRDGKSGRYVRIEHPDGAFTAYMHLDAIAPGLAVGDEVDAGQVVGTLGRTGIFHSEEHLHFNLEITHKGRTLFVDPTAFLVRAKVVPIPARAFANAPEDRPQW
jgi:murein DD-endopeptidase MepM/ murein hydrolase activator NlpD